MVICLVWQTLLKSFTTVRNLTRYQVCININVKKGGCKKIFFIVFAVPVAVPLQMKVVTDDTLYSPVGNITELIYCYEIDVDVSV